MGDFSSISWLSITRSKLRKVMEGSSATEAYSNGVDRFTMIRNK